jgi:cold shock CspA family protein
MHTLLAGQRVQMSAVHDKRHARAVSRNAACNYAHTLEAHAA